MNEMFAVHLKEWQERKRARTNKNVAILSGVQCVHRRDSLSTAQPLISLDCKTHMQLVGGFKCVCGWCGGVLAMSFTLFNPPTIQTNTCAKFKLYHYWTDTPTIHQWTCAFSTLLRVNRCATHTNNTLW